MLLSPKPAKGTMDRTPQDMRLRTWVQERITEAYESRGYTRLETPCIENLTALTNSEGGENLRMIFKILKRGEKLQLTGDVQEDDLCDLGLRFDLTLPLGRFYANNKNQLLKPFKALQMGNVWRAERNQKGRYRQFVQCDVDILGDETIYAEIDLMMTLPKALENIGFQNFTIHINDRRILRKLVEDAGFAEGDFEKVCLIADKKDKIGEEGVKEELLAQGFEEKTVDVFLSSLSKDLQELDCEAAREVEKVIAAVSKHYPIQFDATLVRGMGYYTGMIFEVVSQEFSGSIAGGGRYDNLLSKFSKEQVPAVGFSIGFERIINILQSRGFVPPIQGRRIAVLFAEEDLYEKALEKANTLIAEGHIASIQKVRKNKIGNSVANFKKADYEVLVIDEEESTAKEKDQA